MIWMMIIILGDLLADFFLDFRVLRSRCLRVDLEIRCFNRLIVILVVLGEDDLLERAPREIFREILDLLLIHLQLLHHLDVRFKQLFLLFQYHLHVLSQEVKLSPLKSIHHTNKTHARTNHQSAISK